MQPIFREWHRAWLARRNGSHCSEKPTLYNGGWCYSGSCRLLWPYFLPLPFSFCLSSSSQRGLSWPFTGSFLYPHHPLNILFYILLRIHPSLQFFLSFFSEFIVHVSQWTCVIIFFGHIKYGIHILNLIKTVSLIRAAAQVNTAMGPCVSTFLLTGGIIHLPKLPLIKYKLPALSCSWVSLMI